MRVSVVAAVIGVVVAGCAQQAPDRAPLPDIGSVVTLPPPCAFLIGEGTGVRVDEVTAGSPADGVLRPGDVVVGADGAALLSADDLFEVLADRSPGDTLSLDYERDGARASATVILGTHPRDASRPLIGIGIVTRYGRVEPAMVEPGAISAPLARLVAVEGSIYQFDPVGGDAVSTGLTAPTEPWMVADGRAFFISAAGTPEAVLVDSDGAELALPAGEVPLQLLGSVDDDLLVLLGRADGGVVAARIDVEEDTEVWRSRVEAELGVPVLAFIHPDGSVLAVLRRSVSGGPVSLELWDPATGRTINGPDFAAVGASTYFGWYDEDSLLAAGAEGALRAVDRVTATVTSLEIPVSAVGARIYPVGDTSHILVVRDYEVIVASTVEGEETRVLVDNCEVGVVDVLGAGV